MCLIFFFIIYFRDKTDNLFGSSPKSEPPPSPLPMDVEPEKTIPPRLIDDESSNGSKLSSREPSPVPEPPPTAQTPRVCCLFINK